MKNFKDYVVETANANKPNPVVFSFCRMNPPTAGHGRLIKKVHAIADQRSCPHEIVVSRKQDSYQNPLPLHIKRKHLKSLFPNTNFTSASAESPDILAHATKLYQAGHDELIVVVGGDRIEEMKELLNQYNGKNYNFKSIDVVSAGDRNETDDDSDIDGISATKMRMHAKTGNYDAFVMGMPRNVDQMNVKNLYHDLRKHMGISENLNVNKWHAVFVVGGPNSGKDIVISGLQNEFVELNLTQTYSHLIEQKISSDDHKKEIRKYAINNGQGILINGSATELKKINEIKEGLENIGYQTMMVFVEISNEESYKRNIIRENKGAKILPEFVREQKWESSQNNKNRFKKSFKNFVCLDNNLSENVDEQLYNLDVEIKYFLGRKTTINNIFEEKILTTKKFTKKNVDDVGDKSINTGGNGIGDSIDSRAGGASVAAGGTSSINEKVGFRAFRYKLKEANLSGSDEGGTATPNGLNKEPINEPTKEAPAPEKKKLFPKKTENKEKSKEKLDPEDAPVKSKKINDIVINPELDTSVGMDPQQQKIPSNTI